MFLCPCLKTEKINPNDQKTTIKANSLFNQSKIDFFKRRGSRNPSDINNEHSTPRIRGRETILELEQYEKNLESSPKSSHTDQKVRTKSSTIKGIMLDPNRPRVNKRLNDSISESDKN